MHIKRWILIPALLLTLGGADGFGSFSESNYRLTEPYALDYSLEKRLDTKRTITKVSNYEYLVTVKVSNPGLEGIAKLEEVLPRGFVAREVKSSDGIFSFVDHTVKIIWMNVESGAELTVKYKINGRAVGTGSYSIRGKFSGSGGGSSTNGELKSSSFNFVNDDPQPLVTNTETSPAVGAKEAKNAELEKDFLALLGNGESLLGEKDFDAAIAKFQRALELKPGDPRAKEQLERARLLKENYMASKNTTHPTEQVDYLVEGNRHLEQNNFDEAIAAYEYALKIDPNNFEARDRLLSAKRLKKEREERLRLVSGEGASTELEARALEFNNLMAQGDAALQNGDLTAARNFYEQARDLNPESDLIREKLENLRIRERREALAASEGSGAGDAQDTYQALLMEGNALMAQNEYQKAKDKYEQARSMTDENDEAIRRLREAEARLKEEEAARALANQREHDAKVQQQREEEARKLVERGNRHLEERNYKKAIATFEQAMAMDENNQEAQTRLEEAIRQEEAVVAQALQERKERELEQAGSKAMEQGRYEEAIEQYQALLQVNPEHPKAEEWIERAEQAIVQTDNEIRTQAKILELAREGDEALKESNYERAIVRYQAALELQPDSKALKEKLAEAEQMRTRTLNDQQKMQEFNEFMQQGNTAFSGGDYDQAVASFEQALKLFPGNKEVAEKLKTAKEQRLLAQEEQKDNEAAKAALQARIDEMLGRAKLASEESNYRKAVQITEDAQELSPSNAVVEDKLKQYQAALAQQAEQVQALVQQGDQESAAKNYNAALSSYQEALEIDPFNSDLKAKIQVAESQLNAEQEAVAAQAEERQEQIEALTAVGDEAAEANKLEKALESYREALALNPESIELQQKVMLASNDLEAQKLAEEMQREFELLMEEGDAAMDAIDLDKAMRRYQDALALMPEDREAQRKYLAAEEANLALEAERKAKAAEAERQRQEALLRAEIANYIDEGDRLAAEGRYDEAISSYNKALEKMPGEDNVLAKLESVRLKQREEELMAKRVAVEVQVLIEDAEEQLADDNLEEAKNTLQEALDLDPQNEKVLMLLAEIRATQEAERVVEAAPLGERTEGQLLTMMSVAAEADEHRLTEQNNSQPDGTLQTNIPSPETGETAAAEGRNYREAVVEYPDSAEASTEVFEGELVFKVQVAATKELRATSWVKESYDLTQEVEMMEANGVHKYYSGTFKSYEDAKAYKLQVQSKGLSEAFVVGFYEGEKVDLQQALKIQAAQQP